MFSYKNKIEMFILVTEKEINSNLSALLYTIEFKFKYLTNQIFLFFGYFIFRAMTFGPKKTLWPEIFWPQTLGARTFDENLF